MRNNIIRNHSGFTLIELMLVMGISLFLFAIAASSLFGTGNRASLPNSVEVLVSDIRQQQLKTMLGFTADSPNTYSYGIYFGTNSYTFFRVTAASPNYNPNDPANSVISLGDNITFTNNTIPNSYIVFARGNGNYVNFQNGQNTITLTNTATGQSQTIIFNKLGVISY